jgi:hypothetical protein
MKSTGTRTYPKSRYSDEEILAYMASEEGKIAKWLSFESDHHNMIRERKELGAEW